MTRFVQHQCIRNAAGFALALGALSCSDASGPGSGALQITITSTGGDFPANYQLTIGNGEPRNVPVSSATMIAGLPEGVMRIQLGGIPANCAASTSVIFSQIRAGRTSEVDFNVTCELRTGSLRVIASTQGSPPDVDGYVVLVDDAPAGRAPANGEVTFPAVKRGARSVRLDDVAPNCVAGASQMASVPDGALATLQFTVTCGPEQGAIRFITTTTGSQLDNNGYTVSLAGVDRPLAINSNVVFSGLPAGLYPIVIQGIATNCTLDGSSSRDVGVSNGVTTVVLITVQCVPDIGLLRVTTVTTGPVAPPGTGSYGLIVDFDYYGFTIPINASREFNVVSGAHYVELYNVPPNCSVAGGFSRSVHVPIGSETNVQFNVMCTTAGSVRVLTTTTGLDPDPNGYVLRFPEIPLASFVLPASGTRTITGIPSGTQIALFEGLEPNCSLIGPAQQNVNVVAGATTDVAFAVNCVQLGAIEVVISSNGPGLDANGYRLNVQGPQLNLNRNVPVNGVESFARLPRTGEFTVRLLDVSPNCELTGTSVRTVQVALQQTASVDYQVNCVPPTQIAFTANFADNSNFDIYTVLSNGEGLTRLTTALETDTDPDWSHDGRIAFTSGRDGNMNVYVMNGDGSNVTRLTDHSASDRNPSWSPDGSRIAFVSNRSGTHAIYVMNADGSNVARLTTSSTAEDDPAWSPDGTQIAFTRATAGQTHVFVMPVDGSSPLRLSPPAAFDQSPAWSPDGSRLAYHQILCFYPYYYSCTAQIRTMNGNGTDNLLALGEGSWPSWSPDGKWIAHVAPDCSQPSCRALKILRAGGGDSFTTILGGNISTPAWRR